MIVTAVVALAMVWALHAWDLSHTHYFYGALFGSVGACVSVMQRANTIEVDWRLKGWGLFLQSFLRITLGLMFGAIFVLACKSDFLLGAFKETPNALFMLALVAGFSERMIPDLFARLEGEAAS